MAVDSTELKDDLKIVFETICSIHSSQNTPDLALPKCGLSFCAFELIEDKRISSRLRSFWFYLEIVSLKEILKIYGKIESTIKDRPHCVNARTR